MLDLILIWLILRVSVLWQVCLIGYRILRVQLNNFVTDIQRDIVLVVNEERNSVHRSLHSYLEIRYFLLCLVGKDVNKFNIAIDNAIDVSSNYFSTPVENTRGLFAHAL